MELKPMVFCDTKTVLTYMEANFRFNLALKIPSIRKAEKAAPLIITRLEIYETRIVINDTEYKMKVWRECQADAGLYNGEVDDDADEFGYKISINESMQPGDIKLVYDGSKRRRRGWLRYDCPERMYQRPCNHFIRLYVSGSMTQFPHTNMKMHHLIRRLLTIFIGNRSGECIIKNIDLKDDVLRWPKDGRKVILQNVEIGEYTPFKFDALHSIVDPNVPISRLKTIVSNFQRRILDHSLLKNVEHLVLSNSLEILFRSDLFSMQTQKVSFTHSCSIERSLQRLISTLMEKPRPIGLCYSIRVRSKMNLNIINHPKELEKSKDCMKLEMGDDAIVVIQYVEEKKKTWLNIEIVPKKKKF
ncbi:hypothetical protein B9Z55_000180 [Caenorhabditis nigoni]|uniref:DUF38 domain-containing protein n=1 Tax=Caenorhabditis nigoni TaxID=1611254 RepID=A0A2G5VHA6_9PELO|nr:hypothetical protein B9Z55_000180 [Caenorhabditis nigoni]